MAHPGNEDNDSLQIDCQIAGQLRLTWPVFFDKFGRLTEVQRRTIPSILSGENVLVCAPTATGKTEAVCAPLLENNLYRRDEWLILYISPTRALINDLYERLHKPLSILNVRVARYTGDHHDNLTDARILLTTPESFDSMLCRGKKQDGGHILAHTVALALDEIHFLFGNSRGDQLRWLIERLRRLRAFAKKKRWIADDSLQIVALSATIPAPELICRAYLRPGARIVKVPGGRSIETVTVESESPGIETALPKYVEGLTSPEKILVFSNTRKRVDELSAALREKLSSYGYVVKAHHGSLSKNIREDAEVSMKRESRVILFATSTLEIGIDIGDIDLVVLDGPAPDIQGMLQRIGRGNRRTNQTRVMPCSGNMAEVLIHSAMIESARGGRIGVSSRGPCYCVARQQLASYIFQAPKRSRSKEGLIALLNSCMSAQFSKSVLDHLISEGELLDDLDGIRLGDEWLDRSERGEIHSNIEGMHGMTIVDEATGAQIALGITFSGGKLLQIGGKLLRVKKWGERKIEVREATRKGSPDAAWSYCCRAWAKGAGQQDAVRHYLGFSDNEWPILSSGNFIWVFHFGGSRRKAVLEMILEMNPDIAQSVTVNEWFLRLESKNDSKPEWLTSAGPAMLELRIMENINKLERTLGRPVANRKLPLDVRVDEVRNWLQIDEELERFSDARWIHLDDSDLIEALRILRDETARG